MESSDIVGSQCQLARKHKLFWALASKCFHNLLYFLAKMHTELSSRATLPNMGPFHEAIKLYQHDVAVVTWETIVGVIGGRVGPISRLNTVFCKAENNSIVVSLQCSLSGSP